MKILLDEFEHQIDDVILERGFNYFQKGHVIDVNEFGNGNYKMTVQGSEIYTVCLSIKENVVTAFTCDCPYDKGPVCKHVVAALFYLQSNIRGAFKLSTQKTPKKPREKSTTKQVKELLDILLHEDLKTFIYDTCVKDNKFRQLFLAKYIYLLHSDSKELYTKHLQALIKAYSDRDGFVDYQNAKSLGKIVTQMAEKAIGEIGEGQIRQPLLIAFAIIEEMTAVVSYNADDSNGDLGGSVEDAFAILETLTELNLNKRQHDELFDCLLTLSEIDSVKGWEWQFKPIELAIRLVGTDQEKEKVKAVLAQIKPDKSGWHWEFEQAQELMLELIKKTEGEAAANAFMIRNLSNSQFRVELIEKALHAKNYLKVERLAYEGIAKDEKEFPGEAENWRNYLLIVYQKTGQIKHTIQLARHFFIHSNGRHHPLVYYYELLKSLVPEDQWSDYLSNLIDDIKKEHAWDEYDRLSQVYICEASWDKLWTLLYENANFERIVKAEPYLKDFYSHELAILYRKHTLAYLEYNMGRDYYQTACKYIWRIIRLGEQSLATALIRELKVLYPKRKALLEELNKIQF